MKKLLLILVAVGVFTSIKAQDFDVRNVNWGMSISEVKKTENLILEAETKEFLAYKSKIIGFETMIYYVFKNNRLSQVLYSFNQKNTVKNQYIIDYKLIKNAIKEKHGEPLNYQEKWIDDLYKDDPNQYGMAVAVGALSYKTEWQNARTKIGLMLSGNNFDFSLSCAYFSIEELNKQKEEKKKSSDF